MTRTARAHTARGKWSEADVPHRGWSCSDVEDLGEPSAICEMCESVEIRYVHHMDHSDYTATLGVGCICAEHMEQDYVRPRQREKRLRNEARRRASLPRRKWSASRAGNSYLNTHGFNLTIVPVNGTDGGFRLVVKNLESGRSQRGKETYASVAEAKAATPRALLWAQKRLSR
jgi:hypothetical protein